MKVSACIITKNEENNLPRLLKSIKGKFDEIVLVDTGSTDRTVDIAKEYGCKVYQIEWTGFSDARNYAVSKAAGDWIWHFDADFELEDKEFEKFKNILNLIGKDETFDGISVVYQNLNENGEVKSLSSTVHIHKKSPKIKWVGKVHERIQNSEKKEVVTPPYTVFVKHYGYAVASVQKEKAKRNLELLHKEIKDLNKYSDEYLIKLFYITQSLLALSSFEPENYQEVIKHSKEFLEIYEKIKDISSLEQSIFHKHTYVYMITSLHRTGNIEESEKYLQEALKIDPEYPDLVYLKGLILEEKGKKEEALKTFLDFISISDRISKDNVKFSTVVSDFISQIEILILNKFVDICEKELMETAKNYWKKNKTENLALVYYFLTKNIDSEKAFSLLKKFIKMYQKDLFFVEYSNYLDDIEEKIKILKKGFEKKENSKYINRELGNLYLQKEDYQNAFKHLKKYLEVSKDSSIIPVIKETIEKLGFKKEAEGLLEKIKT
jgi:glycosyltransferase involved in cell wall biosynthesis